MNKEIEFYLNEICILIGINEEKIIEFINKNNLKEKNLITLEKIIKESKIHRIRSALQV